MILRLPNEADDDFDKILMEIYENDDMYFDDHIPQTVISPPVTELLISFFEHVGGLDIMRRRTSFILLRSKRHWFMRFYRIFYAQ